MSVSNGSEGMPDIVAEIRRLADTVECASGAPLVELNPWSIALASLINASREAADEIERMHSWDGLMALLDEHWPDDIFPTLPDDESRDAGPRIVSLLRWVDRRERGRDLANQAAELAEGAAERAEGVIEGMEGEVESLQDEIERLRAERGDTIGYATFEGDDIYIESPVWTDALSATQSLSDDRSRVVVVSELPAVQP